MNNPIDNQFLTRTRFFSPWPKNSSGTGRRRGRQVSYLEPLRAVHYGRPDQGFEQHLGWRSARFDRISWGVHDVLLRKNGH